MSGGSIVLSWGRCGGFYFRKAWATRLGLGFLAITFLPLEIDEFRKVCSRGKI
jgi:hypothetical protein